MGLPQQLPGEQYPGRAIDVDGQVHVADDGCVYLLGGGPQRLLIWPAGSALSDPVRLPDGTELADGDPIRGSGRVVRHAALPGGRDGYWAHVTGFCDDGNDEALLLDEVSAVR
ncbi:MAG TPA: hypothetical protein VM253_11465 [Candidatus Limnocylindrales bacterium]|jgi:hypothetical protein|nr:hypothetical protein [Candidatus Limnocylindrales bacterium]